MWPSLSLGKGGTAQVSFFRIELDSCPGAKRAAITNVDMIVREKNEVSVSASHWPRQGTSSSGQGYCFILNQRLRYSYWFSPWRLSLKPEGPEKHCLLWRECGATGQGAQGPDWRKSFHAPGTETFLFSFCAQLIRETFLKLFPFLCGV